MSALFAAGAYFESPSFVGSGDFTFVSRLRFGSFSAFTTIALLQWSGDSYCSIACDGTLWHGEENETSITSSSPAPATGIWYDVAYRREVNTCTLFVDGAIVASGTITAAGRSGTATIDIGAWSGDPTETDGVSDMDFAVVFNRALSDAEIAQFVAKRAPDVEGYAALWPMHHGAARVMDMSGNGQTLTETGTISDGANHQGYW